MRDNVCCYKCDKQFDVESDEYYSTKEGSTFTVIRCPHCNEPNSIYYSTRVKFRTAKPNENDLKEGEKCYQQTGRNICSQVTPARG